MYYQKLFSLRKDFPALAKGKLLLEEMDVVHPMVFTALGKPKGKLMLVAIALIGREEMVHHTSISISSISISC